MVGGCGKEVRENIFLFERERLNFSFVEFGFINIRVKRLLEVICENLIFVKRLVFLRWLEWVLSISRYCYELNFVFRFLDKYVDVLIFL